MKALRTYLAVIVVFIVVFMLAFAARSAINIIQISDPASTNILTNNQVFTAELRRPVEMPGTTCGVYIWYRTLGAGATNTNHMIFQFGFDRTNSWLDSVSHHIPSGGNGATNSDYSASVSTANYPWVRIIGTNTTGGIMTNINIRFVTK